MKIKETNENLHVASKEGGVGNERCRVRDMVLWDAWHPVRSRLDEFMQVAERVVLLNAVVPYDGYVAMTQVDHSCLREMGRLIAKKMESYVSHPATARALSQLLGVEVPVNKALYQPRAGDVAIVARLRGGARNPADQEVSVSDLELWIVNYVWP